MKTSKLLSGVAAAAVALSLLLTGCAGNTESGSSGELPDSSAPQTESTPDSAAPEESNTLTSLEVVRAMGNGINLGNTLEAYAHQNYLSGSEVTHFETTWGQPITTEEMIQGMKAAGFDTIRIPIAWTNGMNFESGDYTIDERWMNRVDEVVNWALDADMYVIINDHWDGGWWGMFGSGDEATVDKAWEMYRSMWTQIGEHFKDSSYKLIFESANEELGDRLNDKDITGSKGVLNENQCYEMTNAINADFVKTIRAQGGKNADRFLLIAGYNTDITKTCDDRFKMPEDTADSKLLLSVHYYTPWDYCGTDGVTQWGSPDDYDEQNQLFEKLSKFSKQGYGVVIGEYAVMLKNGGIKNDTDKFYSNLLDNCDVYDFCPVLWDCSNFYKRRTNTLADETLAELFSSRAVASEDGKAVEDIKAAAQTRLEETYTFAMEESRVDVDFPASDDQAIAWIMYQSDDYSKAYSVGDNYDPTNKTKGIKATNALITGEGSYTVELDFTGAGGAKGVAFSALGISNGETFFPGYTVTIDSILVNGEPFELSGREYTTSDDSKCTRVNLYNAWVSSLPKEARTPDGDLTDCSAQIMPLGKKQFINTLTINFTFSAPQS